MPRTPPRSIKAESQGLGAGHQYCCSPRYCPGPFPVEPNQSHAGPLQPLKPQSPLTPPLGHHPQGVQGSQLGSECLTYGNSGTKEEQNTSQQNTLHRSRQDGECCTRIQNDAAYKMELSDF